jgi:site-specific DNA recombinase
VREALYRPLYRGEIVWNRTRKRDKWGQHRQQSRPQADWLTISAPHLRIVSDELWNSAHERLRTSRETYLRTTDGQLFGKPTNGMESKYLLTGLMRCGICGGGMYTTSRSHGKRRAYLYACAAFHKRGATVCPNNRSVWMKDTDAEVMQVLQEELLDPIVIELALEQAIATLTTPEAADRLPAVKARLSELERELERLTAAIASGGEMASLAKAVKDREAERTRLRGEQEQLEQWQQAGTRGLGDIRGELHRRVDEWRAMAARNVAQGRQILRKLLDGRVTITPSPDGTCELSGRADYGKLFSGIPLATALASPTGFEPVFWP